MDFEKKLAELFIELPDIPKTLKGVVPAVSVGKQIYVGGLLPFWDGKVAFKGRLGIEISLDQGIMAARYALINALSVVKEHCGSLNKVEKIVQLHSFLAVGGDFKDHERVVDGASSLLYDIFGGAGKHTRRIAGVMSLPQNACLELALLVEVK